MCRHYPAGEVEFARMYQPRFVFDPGPIERAAIAEQALFACHVVWVADNEPDDAVTWHSPAKTQHLVDLMAPLHRARLETRSGRAVGAVFRRTRIENGRSIQRAEVRFDGLAGCLRTPRGGSSRQAIVVVADGEVCSRMLTPREAARLMGLPDSYRLPATSTAALHVAGDGVAVPVVRWLARGLLEPLLNPATAMAAE